MAKRRTWLWIIGGVAATGLVGLVAVAGASVYFVSRHVQAETSTGPKAVDAFDRVTGEFGTRRALYELDAQERPHLTSPLATLPTSPTTPTSLMVQAWDPEKERLVSLSLPFWLLRLGPQHMRVSRRDHSFDFHQLELDFSELERIGPALLLDYRNQDGARVLLWTK
jgi:hypothetical protein